METSPQARLIRFSTGLRLAFWRAISACVAAIMRAPAGLRTFLMSLTIVTAGYLAYALGRAAGSLLAAMVH